MKGVYSKWGLILIALCCVHGKVLAQEEESAEITTEVVEDVFQETFFEALKQKGIGNYDKALNFLVKCKQLEPGEPTVDYEMGRIYLLNRQYFQAEEHLLKALSTVPSNVWYLNEAVHLYLEQESVEKAIVLAKEYAAQGWEQKLILADLYIRNKDKEKAGVLIEQVNNLQGSKAAAIGRRLKLSMEELPEGSTNDIKTPPTTTEEGGAATDTADKYRDALKLLAENKEFNLLLQKSTEAVSNFPAQPEFYYYRALGLVRTGDAEQALLVADEGLAYLLDDKELEKAIYTIMKDAYTILGNEDKIKEMENKLKDKGNEK